MNDKLKAQVLAAGMGSSSFSFRTSGKRIERQGSFYQQRHVQELIDDYKKDPTIDLDDRIPSAVDGDFPPLHHFPTPDEMDESVTMQPKDKRVKFEKGQWCEYLGRDMKWHLAQVRRVVRVAPEQYDPTSLAEPNWEFWYQFDGGNAVQNFDVRASAEGLKRIFGLRPWIWQQWAMVSVHYLAITASIRSDKETGRFVRKITVDSKQCTSATLR